MGNSAFICPAANSAAGAYRVAFNKMKEFQRCCLLKHYQIGQFVRASAAQPVCGATHDFRVPSNADIQRMALEHQRIVAGMIACCEKQGLNPGDFAVATGCPSRMSTAPVGIPISGFGDSSMATRLLPPPQLAPGLPTGNQPGGVLEAPWVPGMFNNAPGMTVPAQQGRAAEVPQRITAQRVGFGGYAPKAVPGFRMPPEAAVPNGGIFDQAFNAPTGSTPVGYRRITRTR